jgi:hypothetical protein
VEWNHLDERILAATMPSTFIESLNDTNVSGYGAGRYNQIPDVEPGPPEPTWIENFGPTRSSGSV